MFIAMGARKLYKSHQEKKAAEAEDAKNGEGAAAAFHQHQNDGYYQHNNDYAIQNNNPYASQQQSQGGHANQPIGQKSDKKQKLECPNCAEQKKIDFRNVRDEQGMRTATCVKCGTQWRF